VHRLFSVHFYENDAFEETTARQRIPAPGIFVFRLDGPDVLCLEALGALGDGELDGLPLLQTTKAVGLNNRETHENIIA